MEAIGYPVGRPDGNILGQVVVQPTNQLLRRQGLFRAKGNHLAPRVNPGIGAAGRDHPRPASGEALYGRLKLALDGRLAGLPLEAVVIRPIVFNY